MFLGLKLVFSTFQETVRNIVILKDVIHSQNVTTFCNILQTNHKHELHWVEKCQNDNRN